MKSEEETFDDALYRIVILDQDGREIEVAGDAAGTYRWEGSSLPPVYESGSGGMMLEPAEEPYPDDIVVTGLTEAKAQYKDNQESLELSPGQQDKIVEELNQDKTFMDELYTRIQESYYA